MGWDAFLWPHPMDFLSQRSFSPASLLWVGASAPCTGWRSSIELASEFVSGCYPSWPKTRYSIVDVVQWVLKQEWLVLVWLCCFLMQLMILLYFFSVRAHCWLAFSLWSLTTCPPSPQVLSNRYKLVFPTWDIGRWELASSQWRSLRQRERASFE